MGNLLPIIKVDKPITGLAWDSKLNCKVGVKGVKEIIPYEEAGEMSMVLWFEVRWESGTFIRYNGKYVAGVMY